MNLLDETKGAISQSGHSTDDVRFVGSRDGKLGIPWSQAEKVLDIDYDDGYGGQEIAAEYVAQREAMKGIGRALGTKMALRLQQLEQLQEPTEARRIQAQSKAFERVCDILSRHGYQISRWTRTEDLETRLKELDEALSSVVPTGTVDRETLYAISCLQQLRTTLGLQDRKEHGR